MKAKARERADIKMMDRREKLKVLQKERAEREERKSVRDNLIKERRAVMNLRTHGASGLVEKKARAGIKNIAKNLKKNQNSVKKRKETGPWGGFGSSSSSNPFTGGSYNPWTGKSSSEKKKSRGENITITIRR